MNAELRRIVKQKIIKQLTACDYVGYKEGEISYSDLSQMFGPGSGYLVLKTKDINLVFNQKGKSVQYVEGKLTGQTFGTVYGFQTMHDSVIFFKQHDN